MAKVRRKKSTTIIIITILLAIIYMQLSTSIPDILPDLDKEDAPPVTGIHPVVLDQKNKLVAKVREIGIKIIITDGYRSDEEQNRLYKQGRSTEGDIVTNAQAGESMHNYGLAIDFALQLKDGSVIWDMEYDGNGNGRSDWMEVVAIAKDLGFQWGGDWTNFPDYPHLQIDFGLTIRDLKRGKRPPVDSHEYLEALK
ncbi:peptidoglycan L-alanyl-D-glutamate endopeptidase CwlK [Paenibacillus uliginis N3/975]|uniref:Peptidoglycan L-alanyl-D-glutamate endopeptidase CwlK n=1 Tax=Paenibacillus uliginis N3/975 TaxID=1313296 RepID=A0A1X7HMU5_9BACL|nr:M15 family metallopeptidase [Paenibacillus uliginis]SMF89603.1 peptidoglycan L-alanyl-D-glutamate endopeptidase CwlK [Paenibacillus uliginis N3/975]